MYSLCPPNQPTFREKFMKPVSDSFHRVLACIQIKGKDQETLSDNRTTVLGACQQFPCSYFILVK